MAAKPETIILSLSTTQKMNLYLEIFYWSNSFQSVSKHERFRLRGKMFCHQCKVVFILHKQSKVFVHIISISFLKIFLKSFHLSRGVNVVHVTINIPFNDKSMPEKDFLLHHPGELHQSPYIKKISTISQNYQLLKKETDLIFPRALISFWLSRGRFNCRSTSRQFSSLLFCGF